jgi:hypothetical protein
MLEIFIRIVIDICFHECTKFKERDAIIPNLSKSGKVRFGHK